MRVSALTSLNRHKLPSYDRTSQLYPMRTHRILATSIASALAISILGNSSVSAATWTGATDGSWATGTNWTGTAPDNITTQAIAFDATSIANLTQTLDGSYSLSTFTVNSTTPGTGAITIDPDQTNTLTFTVGSTSTSTTFDIRQLSDNPLVINSNVVSSVVTPAGGASGRLTFQAAGTAGLTINGSVTHTAGAADTLIIRGTSTGAGGGIVNGAINITGVLNKVDAGDWTLNAANTAGSVQISSGKLLLGNDGALGTGLVSVTNGTAAITGTISSSNSTARSLSNNFTLSATAAVVNTLALDSTNADLTLNGNITESGANLGHKLAVTGTKTVTLNGTNSFTGGTTVSGGYLVFSSGAAVPRPRHRAVPARREAPGPWRARQSRPRTQVASSCLRPAPQLP